MPVELTAALSTVEVRGNSATVGDRKISATSEHALRAALADSLYDLLHAGQVSPDMALDADLLPALTAAVPHSSTRVVGTVVSAGESGELVVDLDGIRTTVHAPDSPVEVGTELPIRIPCARPYLSPGFFVVDGSAGHSLSSSRPVMRLYAHLVEPGEVPGVLRSALLVLESSGFPYRLKVCSSAEAFPRRDALVVYLAGRNMAAASLLVAHLAGAKGIGDEVSVFAKQLAPGLAIACQPQDDRPGYTGLSFGEHRSRLVAEGMIAHARGASGDLDEVIATALRAGNVDARRPYQNRLFPAA